MTIHEGLMWATVLVQAGGSAVVLVWEWLRVRKVRRTAPLVRIRVQLWPAKGGGWVAIVPEHSPFRLWAPTLPELRRQLAKEGPRLAVFYALAELGQRTAIIVEEPSLAA